VTGKQLDVSQRTAGLTITSTMASTIGRAGH
jgi:hypothetical protein